MYDLIEYIANYSKTSGRLWHYYRYEQVLNDGVGTLADFHGNSALFKFKQEIQVKQEIAVQKC